MTPKAPVLERAPQVEAGYERGIGLNRGGIFMSQAKWKAEVLLKGSWRGATSVLVSNQRTRIVVDTGLPHEARQLVEALARKGLQPSEIGIVICTHFHVDHVLNNSLFPQSAIYATQESYEWSRSLYSDLSNEAAWEKLLLKYYPEIFEYEKSKENMGKLRKLALRWWDVKRLGSPSQLRWIETERLPEGLESLLTWGHVPGHLSILIRNGDPPTVVAADALMSPGDETPVLTMIPHNRKQYERDRARILSFGGRIIPGHDGEFFAGPNKTEEVKTK